MFVDDNNKSILFAHMLETYNQRHGKQKKKTLRISTQE